MITLKTSGVIGMDYLLQEYELADYVVFNLSKLYSNLGDLLSFRISIQSSTGDSFPILLYLDSPMDFKTVENIFSVGEDLVVSEILEILQSVPSSCELVILGPEYGLSFVPMKASVREEIRWMSEFIDRVAKVSDQIYICFPGRSDIRLSSPSLVLSSILE